jgi:hypothetical protein
MQYWSGETNHCAIPGCLPVLNEVKEMRRSPFPAAGLL